LSRRKKRKKKLNTVEILSFIAMGVFVVGLVWLAFSTPQQGPSQTKTTTGTILPTLASATDFTLTDVDGNTFRLSDQRGKIVVIEFMRTKCEACILAGPYMKELRSRFGNDVVMVMISVDPSSDTESILRSYREKDMPGWIALRDTPTLQVSTEYSMAPNYATPTIFVIDKDGYIRYHQDGFLPSVLTDLINDIDSLRK
jgi:cytochrome oxidase Cu insertion factor (SCO1/SenC/PrrC family)